MMPTPVKLSKIIEAIECQADDITAYLNLKTGKLVTRIEEAYSAAENDEPLGDYPEWEREIIIAVRDPLEHEMTKGAMSSPLHCTSAQYLIECYQINQPGKTNGN